MINDINITPAIQVAFGRVWQRKCYNKSCSGVKEYDILQDWSLLDIC